MKLSEYLDTGKLEEYVAEGWIYRKRHDKFPLSIYCYSRETVYADKWDAITEKCRGLIVNDITGEIVARPFPKFFNLNTPDRPETYYENLPPGPPHVAEKLDGSLGILYQYRGYHGIASKASFHSDHAQWATAYYHKHIYRAMGEDSACIWPVGHTPVFEMICQEVEHHVVHYDRDKLVLLAMINNETGEEVNPRTLYTWANSNFTEPIPFYDKTVKAVIEEDRVNYEGYILSWFRAGREPLKVKVKHPQFLKWQKIVHETTAKNVFQALRAGDMEKLESWMNLSSPYLRSTVKEWTDNFNAEYQKIRKAASDIVLHGLGRFETRKEFALYLQQPENKYYAHVCYAMMDEKDYKEIVWDLVEPLTKKQVEYKQGE